MGACFVPIDIAAVNQNVGQPHRLRDDDVRPIFDSTSCQRIDQARNFAP
jgi:hypothetical protein